MSRRMTAGPPETARRLVRWSVGADEADVADGELVEAYLERVRRWGPARARLWCWRQVAGFVVRAPVARRARTGRETMGAYEWMGDVGRDVRWAVRGIVKRPTHAAVVMLTLALGIGAVSAIFTLVSAYFLTPLPYAEPDRVVLLWETDRNSLDVTTVAPGNYFAWKEQARSFADIAAFNVDGATLSGDGLAESVRSSVVTPNFFDVLGAEPRYGDGFDADRTREADGALVILSHALWQRRYAADPSIVGRDVRIDGRPHTVVGVMPPTFRQPERSLTWQAPELWRPLVLDDSREDFGSRYLRTVARMAPGVTLAQAREEMAVVSSRMIEAQPESNRGRSVLVWTLDDYLMGDGRSTLMLLLLAGVAVLLIVCANVANLTLARGEERQRELAVRAALGSGGKRLVRQLTVESILLSLGGAALGVLAVWGGRGALQAVHERFFSGLVDARVDAKVLGLAVVVAVAVGMLFGLPLALRAARGDLRAALVEGGQRTGSGVAARSTRNLLIVGQVAMATTLLIVAALLSRSFVELVNVPPGFAVADRVTFEVSAPSAAYPDRDAVVAYYRELWREVEAVPGVRSLAMISDMPFTTENRWTTFGLEGVPYDEETAPRAEFHVVDAEYFDVLEIPVLAGTPFEPRWEATDGEVPIVVSERLAEMVDPGGDVVGKAILLPWGESPIPVRIVAVVGDVLDDGFDATPGPRFYMSFADNPNRMMALIVRAEGDAGPVMEGLRRAVARVDPDIPAGDLRSLDGMLAETVTRPRAASLIAGAFAVLALLVASTGIYGVFSWGVQRRWREMGVRSALGASASQIVGLVMGSAARLLALGLALGVVGAWMAGAALSGLLFGVRSWDPLSTLAAIAALGGVGGLAAWLPARRAVGVDPTEALRAE